MSAKAFRLGLTGGIGSGKSTVATLLAKMGASIIDADAISRESTEAGGAAIAPIRTHFGPAMLTPTGALNREQMRNLVFSDPTAKARLEAIIHPIVGHEIALRTTQAEYSDTPCIVFDIPLLAESAHWRTMLHRILVIDCTQDTQIARVTARNGLNPDAIRNILAAQASRAQRLAVADIVLFNDGITIDELEQQVHQIAPQFGL